MSKEQDKCYICYEEQSEENRFVDPNPCNCRGTIKIHVTCFDTLTTTYDTCGVCKTKYLQNGYKKYYDPDGHLREEGLLVNGLKTGLWKTWTIWHTDNQLYEKVNYIDGKRNGLYQRLYSNGQLMCQCNYVDGMIHGLYQSWYINCQLELKVNYVNGQINGLYQFWYSNGQLKKR